MDDTYYRTLAAAASTLEERVAAGCIPLDEPEDRDRGRALLARWSRSVYQGDDRKLASRLSWSGLTPECAVGLAGRVRWPEDRELPGWTRTLRRTLETARLGAVLDEPPSFLRASTPVPFEHVLAPLVTAAQDQLAACAGGSLGRLAAQAKDDLARGLLRSLAGVCTQQLSFELEAFQAAHETQISRWVRRSQSRSSTAIYERFCAHLWNGFLPDLLAEYPCLGRWVGSVLRTWVETTAELVRRLDQDWSALHACFDASFGQISRIDPMRSDRHRGGRTVAFLMADDGTKLVYKPRDVDLDRRYGQLLRWIAERSNGDLALTAPTTLPRSGYGWVRFVARQPCASPADVSRYYHRAGALLCLLYVLDASDCHHENLVAHGDVPVLVDIETLMHPGRDRRRYGESVTVRAVALQHMSRSVLSTGLLPIWSTDLHGGFYDGSGFGGVTTQRTANAYPYWTNVNSDDSELRYQSGTVVPRSNVVTLGSQPVDPNDHVDACVAGFVSMYRWLMAHRDSLVADDSPVHALAGQRCRYVHRMTREYSALLRQLVQRRSLASGAEVTILLDGLMRRDAVAEELPPPTWPLLAAEQRSLARLDTPYFSALSNAETLDLEDGDGLDGFFLHSGFEGMLSNIEGLSPVDLQLQEQFIRTSFAARRATGLHSADNTNDAAGSTVPFAGAREAMSDADVDGNVILDTARDIADKLVESAITSGDHLTWVGLEAIDMGARFQLQPLGPSLYSGAVGVALFFAALARATDDEVYRGVSFSCLAPLRDAVRQPDFMSRGPIGGCTGLGSVAYGLATAGHLLGDDELVRDAVRVARGIVDELIADDKTCDVVHGAAGAILALHAVHAVTAAPDLLERAARCGEHVLNKRIAGADGHAAWRAPDGRTLTGFSHGAAGIACALARLARDTCDTRFSGACQEALDFERSLQVDGGWLGSPGQPTRFMAWCHGATGIGLTRISIEEDLAFELDEDLRMAVDQTLAHGIGGLDHVCCGSSGRIELLLTAGHARDNQDWLTESRLWTAQVINRARRQGGFRTMKEAPPALAPPGFFQGLAGIGYTLLRVRDPRSLPCVLLWRSVAAL